MICSDCYDNANIYSRTRDYCPYAYLGEDDPLDKTLPGLKEGFGEHAQHEDTALESLISNQDSSVFLTSHDKRLSSHTPPEHYANGETEEQTPDLPSRARRRHQFLSASKLSRPTS